MLTATIKETHDSVVINLANKATNTTMRLAYNRFSDSARSKGNEMTQAMLNTISQKFSNYHDTRNDTVGGHARHIKATAETCTNFLELAHKL